MTPPAGPHSRADTLARILTAHPRGIVAAAVVLALVGAALAASRLHLDADTNHLIAEDRPFMEPFLGWLDEFGDLEAAYVVVDGHENDDSADAAVEARVPGARCVRPRATNLVGAALIALAAIPGGLQETARMRLIAGE